MDIKDRIQLFLKENNLSAAQFAEITKIQRSNLSHILTGRNKPSMDFFEKICKHFPDVDLFWMLTGNIKKEDQKIENLKLESNKNNIPNSKNIEKIITFYKDKSFDIYLPNQE
jgi:transcriptional regulator with XRE-family HTH domain